MELSLLRETPAVETPPDSLDINREGDVVYMRLLPPRDQKFMVLKFDIAEGKLGAPTLLHSSESIIRAYIKGHPYRDESLVIANRQRSPETVADVVWRVYQGGVSSVPYEETTGMPEEGPHDTWYGLEPFYSWDGNLVVVPLRHGGLCIYNSVQRQGLWVAYPDFPGTITGQALGALPDEGGRRRIYASFWAASVPDDVCQLHILDLDTLEWTHKVELNWIVYEVAADDVEFGPWLVRGSRAPQTNVEHKRVPRLARLDPASGAQDLLEFWGEPAWEAQLEPHGRFIVYMDRQRQGLVRLDPASGELDLDPRWYHEEAKIFVAEGGDPVYLWHRGVLLQAEWSQHEQFEGYGSD